MPTLDLASATYSPDAQGFFLAFARYKGQQTPNHYDGDFSRVNFTGIGLPEHPFASVGDKSSAIVRQRCVQDAASFKPTALGTANRHDGRLLLIDETDFQDEGGRIVKWTQVYANVPPAHDQFGSMSYGYQYLYGSGSDLQLQELPFQVNCRIRTEYFLVNKLGSFPILEAPRAVKLATATIKRGTGNLYQQGIFILSNDPEIVAEDSTLDYWHYPIMFRRTPWIAGPTLKFWGNNTSLPVGNA